MSVSGPDPVAVFWPASPAEGKPADALGVASSDRAAAAVSDARACVLSFSDAHSFRAGKGRIQMTLWPRALLLSGLVIGVNAGDDLPAQADPIQVSGGLVSGVAAGGVQTYKGIPYAKPPVGDLRWRAPQSVATWSGILVADHFSPICVQPDPLGGHSFFTRLFFNPIEPRSEDCLYLNAGGTGLAPERASRGPRLRPDLDHGIGRRQAPGDGVDSGRRICRRLGWR
jgi:hypothetical protein